MREGKRSAKVLRAAAIGLAALSLLIVPLAAPRGGPGDAGQPAPGTPVSPPAAVPASPTEAAVRVAERLGSLPLCFEANRGQAEPAADFIARGRGSAVTLSKGGADIALGRCGSAEAVRLRLIGASAEPVASGLDERPGKVHYVSGDRADWITGVPTYGEVAYRYVYPGTDLIWHGREGRLEFDFVLAPGADPGAIALRYEGARSVAVDGRGDLVIESASGAEVRQHRPVAYQEAPSGAREEVPARYSLAEDGLVALAVGPYDPARRLTIDPFLSYSTLFGEGGEEVAKGIAVDELGRAHVVGTCDCGGGFDTFVASEFGAFLANESDAFLFRLDPEGTAFEYILNIRGSGQDEALGVAVDPDGVFAYVTGFTTSVDFPVTNTLGADAGPGGSEDAFVMVVDDVGTPTYSSTFGSEGNDRGHGIAVDANGVMYITGFAHEGFPSQPDAFIPGNGDAQVFVAKVERGQSKLVLDDSFVFGSQFDDAGNGIALGSCDPLTGCDAFVTGASGRAAFIKRLGDQVMYEIQFASGAGTGDAGTGIAVDADDNAYVTGFGFDTLPGGGCAFQGGPLGSPDAFVVKVDPFGSVLYARFLGGPPAPDGTPAQTIGRSIAVDGRGRAFVTGHTTSPFFPTKRAFQKALAGTSDAFVTALDPDGCALSYSTYLGGTDTFSADCRRFGPVVESGFGIAVDAQGSAYVAGTTPSIKFPTSASAPQPDFGGSCADAFAVKIEEISDLEIEKVSSPDPATAGELLTYTIKVTNHGPSGATGVIVRDNLPTPVSHDSGQSVLVLPVGDLDVDQSMTLEVVEVSVDPRARGVIANRVSVTANEREPVPDGHPNLVIETTAVQALADLALTKVGPEGPVVAGSDSSFFFEITNNGPSSATGITLVDFLPPGFTFVRASSDCSGSEAGVAVPMNCSVDADGVLTCELVGLELLPGQACGATVVIHAAFDMPESTVRNSALIAGAEPDVTVLNNGDFADVSVIRKADLAISKVADLTTALAGGPLTYTITVVNSGPSVATDVRVSDALPFGASLIGPAPCPQLPSPPEVTVLGCGLGTMNPGDERMITIPILVDPSQVAPLVNFAGVAATELDPDHAEDDQVQLETPVERRSTLTVVKTADKDPVVAGTQVLYRIDVRNEGPSTAREISIRDELPGLTRFVPGASSPGCSEDPGSPGVVDCGLPDLLPGAVASVTIAAFVDPARDGSEALRNGVLASHGTAGGRAFTDLFVLSTGVVRETDLEVTKLDEQDPVVAGGQVVYHITVRNRGPSNARDVVLEDFLPPDVEYLSSSSSTPLVGSNNQGGTVTFGIGDFAVGESIEVTIFGHVFAGAQPSAENRARVTFDMADSTDPDPSNNEVRESTAFPRQVQLRVEKSAPSPAVAGEELTYTITAVNDGPSTAQGVVLRETLDASVAFVGSGPSGPECFAPVPPFVGVFACEVGDIPPGVPVERTVVVRVSSGARGVIRNIVEIAGADAGAEGGESLGDNVSVLDTEVVRRADIALETTDVPEAVLAGARFSLTHVVRNLGPSDAEGVAIAGALPPGTRFVSASRPSSASETAVVVEIGDLAAGEEASVTVTVDVDPEAPATLKSEAVASAAEEDPDLTNNATEGEIEVTRSPVAQAPSVGLQGGGCAAAAGGGDPWATLPLGVLALLLAAVRARGRPPRATTA